MNESIGGNGMGFFGKLIKDAIGDGISKAVGEAVKKAAAPVAEKLANLTAGQLEEAAGNAAASGNAEKTGKAVTAGNAVAAGKTEASSRSSETAGKTVAAGNAGAVDKSEAVQKDAGSSLESAFANLEKAAQNFSTAVMDASLAASTNANVDESSDASAKVSLDVIWDNYLAGMPKYTVQASEILIDESGTTDEGAPIYWISISGTSDLAYETYLKILKANGYVNYYPNSDETMYKQCNGYVLGFNQTDCKYEEGKYDFRAWRATCKEKLR